MTMTLDSKAALGTAKLETAPISATKVETAPDSTAEKPKQRPKGMTVKEYCDANHEAIIADMAVMRNKDLCRKWGFPESTFYGLVKPSWEKKGWIPAYEKRVKGKKIEPSKPLSKKPENMTKNMPEKPVPTIADAVEIQNFHPDRPPAPAKPVSESKDITRRILGYLVNFPQFNESWPSDVKIKWLEVFENIAGARE